MPTRWSTYLFTVSTLALLAAVACSRPPRFRGTAVEPVAAAPALTGVNWDGQPFRLDDLRGKVAVVFFGYTYCPDVCPFALAKMKQLYAALGAGAEDTAVVFASVDARRDSVDKLAQYVPGFDRRFYGLHLDGDDLAAAREGWDLTVQFGQPKDGPGTDSFYYVDHTGTFFLVDRDGNLRVTFPPTASADDLLPDIETLLRG